MSKYEGGRNTREPFFLLKLIERIWGKEERLCVLEKRKTSTPTTFPTTFFSFGGKRLQLSAEVFSRVWWRNLSYLPLLFLVCWYLRKEKEYFQGFPEKGWISWSPWYVAKWVPFPFYLRRSRQVLRRTVRVVVVGGGQWGEQFASSTYYLIILVLTSAILVT